MPPTSTQPAVSTRGEKVSTILKLCLMLMLHRLLFLYAAFSRAINEFYLHTLLLLTFPVLIGSFQNLKQYQRWTLYYGIWFQLITDTWAIEDLAHFFFDLTIFAHMEGVFQRHVMTVTGGQPIPRGVYFSSWVSNTKLESYIAAHRSVEIVDDNEDDSDEMLPAPTTSTTTTTTASRSTTTATTKAKLGYLLATIVLLITVYQEIKTKYRDYICHHNLDSFGPFDSTTNYFILNSTYTAYCITGRSTFEWTLIDRLPFLDDYLPSSLRMFFTRLPALFFALAWSTIPTTVVVKAWTQMWNSPSSSHRIRKVHYVVFMYPLKMAVLPLIMYYTADRQEDVEGADYARSSLGRARAKYMLIWFVLFRAAAKLAFGLGLIWNLYVAHSKDATAVRIHHPHQEEEKKGVEQVL